MGIPRKLWKVKTLSFQPVSMQKKTEIISRVLAGERMQPIARDIGFTELIYIWAEGKGKASYIDW